ncbi:MAG: T9SS type A sorting domain-containing protein [Sphingobacteriaceae bacterium]|nr:MAG: T9SS type A sorting domain-containing protein [Sphingobacteriaceae bacterium]
MKRILLILNLFVLQVIFFGSAAFAGEPTWKSYTSNSMVKNMYENNGSMWVATFGGLIKYDLESGKKTYFTKAENGLPSNSVEDVTSDLSGNIWIGTYDAGIAMFDGSKWTNFNMKNSKLPSDAVRSVESDSKGNIYVGTGNGLVIINNNKWTVLNGDNSTLTSPDIWAMDDAEENGLWIGTSFGVYQYLDSVFTDYSDSLPLYGVTGIDYSPLYGAVAIGGGGAFRLDNRDKTWRTIGNINEETDLLNAQYVKSDASGNLWVTSFNSVHKYNKYDGDNWISYDAIGSQNAALCIDKNETLWGAGANGINKFSNNSWEHVTTLNYTIPENYIRTITSDKKGTIWINGGSTITRYAKNNWEVFTTQNSKLPSTSVHKVRVDKTGNTWFATDKGLAEFTDGNWVVFDMKSSALPVENISDVAFDKDGNIWAVHEQGISIIDTKEWEQIENPATLKENERLLTIVFDGENTAWLSTSVGNIYSYKNQTWKRFSYDDKTFAGGYVMDMKFDPKTNKLWAGTWGGGLNYFDGTTWNNYKAEPIIISALLMDAENNMWSSAMYPTSLEITKPNGEKVIYNAENSPLPATNITALEQDENGNIWIGTDAGIVVYQTGESANIQTTKKADETNRGKLFPNPAAEQTTLSFTLGKKSQVAINITDITGKSLSTLPVENLTAGLQQIKLPIDNLPNGTYIVKLQADHLTTNYKLIINR